MSEGINRREFLVKGAVAGAGLVSAGWLASCTRTASAVAAGGGTVSTPVASAGQAAVAQDATKSKVALYTDENLMETETKPRLDRVLAMLDRGMVRVFGTENAEKAWQQVASPEDVVALKVNCICARLASNPVVAAAIAQRLMEVGVLPQNIIIFDRTSGELRNAGYELVKTGTDKPYCYGIDGDYGAPITQGTFTGGIANLLTQKATVLINVPVMKDWGGSQVTMALKSHLGSINNPGAQHRDMAHTIPDLNATDPIRTKTRLVVLDASRGCWAGGPGPQPGTIWTYKGLLVSRDPVAADYVGNTIINNKRAELGQKPIAAPDGISRYLPVAAAMGLGKASQAEIDLVHEQIT